eukprot:GSChrysophyteH2.ASY1.ANO1.923.1 assembled CDS
MVPLDLAVAALLLCIGLSLISHTHAGFRCHNNCSGHGKCSNEDKCICNEAWNTTRPDCSWRRCPYGTAWADKPYSLDTAHSPLGVECSGRGECNRYSGMCGCFPGYAGMACERFACPNDCNGHGQCMTTNQQYIHHNKDRNRTHTYTLWDAEKTAGCVCDPGFTGGQCELRYCPKGHDPIVTITDYHEITLQTEADSGTLGGEFKLTFHDKYFYFPAVADWWSSEKCKASFESLPNIKTVTCVKGTNANGGATWTIDFKAWPTNPYENNVYMHRGRPEIDSFHCSVDKVTLTDPTDTDHVPNTEVTIPLYEPCSNRGICDLESGNCRCFLNFYGANCAHFAPDGVVRNLADVMSITVTDPAFDANILHLADTVRGENKWSSLIMETNFDQYNDNRDVLWNMTAWGDIDMNYGGINIIATENSGDNGLHINQGGLRVTGGMTVASAGLHIVGEGTTNMFGHTTFSPDDLHLDGSINIVEGLDLDAMLTVNNTECDDPRGLLIGAGGVKVENAGIVVQGGASVVGGLMLEHPFTGGRTKGVTIATGGLDIRNGGFTVNEKGLTVGREMNVHDTGLTVTEGMTVSQNGLKIVTGGLSVPEDGLTVGQRLNLVGTEGLYVTASDVVVNAGGMQTGAQTSARPDGAVIVGTGCEVEEVGVEVVFGKTNIHQGGLKVTNGMTVNSKGVSVTGGLTVADEGIKSGSLQLDYSIVGGLKVVDGLEYYYGTEGPWGTPKSMHIAKDGMTVEDTGLTVKGGFTIGDDTVTLLFNPGFKIDGGVSVVGGMKLKSNTAISNRENKMLIKDLGLETPKASLGGGVTLASGLTVYDVGVKIDGIGGATALNVQSGGMKVTGGLTVSHSNGMLVKTGGVSVEDSGGLRVTAGLTIGSGGMVVSSVSAGGPENGYKNVHDVDGMYVTGALGWPANNMNIAGGVTIETAGVVASAATVSSDGATVTGGMTVQSGGMRVSGAGLGGVNHRVVKDGVTVDSLSISSSGLVVDSIVDTGYLYITDGLTVSDKGMTVNNREWGLRVTGGVSVMRGSVAGGIRIADGGIDMDVGGSMNIQGGGFVVKGGVVLDKGLNSAKKMQVNGGLMVTSGDVTITDGGLVIDSIDEPMGERGLTVGTTDSTTNIDLVVSQGGLTVSAGTIKYSGTLTTTSDRRLKENIVLIKSDDAREAVKQLKGVFYDWNSDHTHSQRILNGLQSARNASATFKELPTRRTGLIAQDVQKVLPHVVTRLNTTEKASEQEDDPLLGIAYQDVIPYLVSAIQGMDEWVQSEQQQQMQSAQDLARLAVKDLEATLERAEKRSQALYQRASL